ncbi:hypothetical protein ACWYXK_19670 [Janthinobacterium lividum]
MCPFNTAKKIKSTEKVVIFIEGSMASGAPWRVFSYEKAQKFVICAAVVFVKTFSEVGRISGPPRRASALSDALLAAKACFRGIAGLDVSAYALRAKPTYADLHRPAVARGHLW